MLDTVFHQWDRRWRSLTLGHGPSKFWGGACVMFSVMHAARAMGTSPALDPAHANELFRVGRCFDGDELRIHDAAALVGLEAPLEERVAGAPGDDKIADAIAEAFALGMAILGVDDDGDGKVNHTVLAHDVAALEGGALDLDIADSAALNGRERIAWPDLIGHVRWENEPAPAKRYRVIVVRPIRKKGAKAELLQPQSVAQYAE